MRAVDAARPAVLFVAPPDAFERARRTLERCHWEAHQLPFRAEAVATARDLVIDSIFVEGSGNAAGCALLCATIRADDHFAKIPVFAIAEDSSPAERTVILEAGADDCWQEGPERYEFELRCRALRRRFLAAEQPRMLRSGALELDLERRTVTAGGAHVCLPTAQAKLLQYFMENPGTLFTSRQLRAQVWGEPHVRELAVKRCVARLRAALDLIGSPPVIHSGGAGTTYIFGDARDPQLAG